MFRVGVCKGAYNSSVAEAGVAAHPVFALTAAVACESVSHPDRKTSVGYHHLRNHPATTMVLLDLSILRRFDWDLPGP